MNEKVNSSIHPLFGPNKFPIAHEYFILRRPYSQYFPILSYHKKLSIFTLAEASLRRIQMNIDDTPAIFCAKG